MWIAAKASATGDVIGVHEGDSRGVFIGSVPEHESDEPGAYVIIEEDDIPTLIEVLEEAIDELKKMRGEK